MFQIKVLHTWSYSQILWSLANTCHVIIAHKIKIFKLTVFPLGPWLNYDNRECATNRQFGATRRGVCQTNDPNRIGWIDSSKTKKQAMLALGNVCQHTHTHTHTTHTPLTLNSSGINMGLACDSSVLFMVRATRVFRVTVNRLNITIYMW